MLIKWRIDNNMLRSLKINDKKKKEEKVENHRISFDLGR
jgi:hypothetical protein